MSYHGKNPRLDSIRYTPLDADPASAATGDIFYASDAHGSRDEGLWVYDGSDWSQVSTGATLSTVANLTLTPQSSDPGSPTVGMIFVSDGTPRAAGLWIYTSGGWAQISGVRYQEFTQKEFVDVRAATTANITLASQLENGDTIDGVVLATGDLVLVKNQNTASENGVYVVAASGAPARHSSADSASEVNNYAAHVQLGTTNINSFWFQTATLSSLSDNQTWATSPAAQTWTVAPGVYEISIEACAAGGGGGGGANSGATRSSAGGGAGALPLFAKYKVTPGDTITVNLGVGGKGGAGKSSFPGNPGTAGGNTTISGSGISLTLVGATFGTGPVDGTTGGSGGSGAAGGVTRIGALYTEGGNGDNNSSSGGEEGQSSIYAAGGTFNGGSRSSGGGGAGRGAGGNGVIDGVAGTNAAVNTGAGGAGSAAASNVLFGGRGGSGYVRFSW